jgi:hypothetical protein
MKIRTVLVAAVVATGALFAGVTPASATPSDAPVTALAGIGTYRFTVATGDLDNADTDDAVRFTFVGTEASSPPIRIESDFGRGSVKTFGPYNWVSLGTVTGVYVTKSNVEKDAWYLDYVQIQEQGTGTIRTCEADVWFPQTGPKKFFTCA